MRFEIYRYSGGATAQWCWRLRANEEVVAFGEGYRRRTDCVRAVEMVRETTRLTPIVDEV